MEFRQLYATTPLVEETLPVFPGKKVFYKMEANQPCGSFKLRGMQVACKDAIENGATKLLASSGGNAGLAVAYVGYNWNIPTTVVLPDTTPENVIDHPKLWEGHSTIVDDLVWQCPEKPDAIVLSVGGGGMMNGVVEGLVRNGWEDVEIVAVETEGAASLNAAVAAGKPVSIDGITSIAKSLGAQCVAEKAFENTQKYSIVSHLVNDETSCRACVRFADEHRVLVEPACGASLSVVYDNDDVLGKYRNIVVIVCGGSKVDLDQIAEWRKL